MQSMFYISVSFNPGQAIDKPEQRVYLNATINFTKISETGILSLVYKSIVTGFLIYSVQFTELMNPNYS